MTQEDKAKAYDEALERAKNLHKDAIDMGETLRAKQCEIIFPELAESEDEKVRKALVDALNKNLGNGIEKYGTTFNAALAWLEKHGEKKPADKVEPKFKVGDIVEHSLYAGLYYIVKSINPAGDYKLECLNGNSGNNIAAATEKFLSLCSIETEYVWDTEKKELKKIKKPAEWSEEDEKHIDSLLKRLEGLCRNEFERTRFAINEDQDWLNQLKERIKN